MVVHLEGRGRGGEISGKGERGRRREDKAEGGGKCRRTHSQPLTEYCMQFALGPVRHTYIHTCCPGIPGGCTTGGRIGYITWFWAGYNGEERDGDKQSFSLHVHMYVCMYVHVVHAYEALLHG